MQKSNVERFRMAFEMVDMGQRIVETNLNQQHPDWSTGQLKAAVFERIYRDDFSADEMERIMASILAFHDRQTA